MIRNLYRLRMGKHAETLFRRSRRDMQQMIWWQCNLMQLRNELVRSEHWPKAAGQPVWYGDNPLEIVACVSHATSERISGSQHHSGGFRSV